MKRLSKILGASFLFFFYTSTAEAQCAPQDSLALVDLYNSTMGPNWVNNSNWLTGPVHAWYGITMTTDGTRVTKIELPGNNLVEVLPGSLCNLTELDIFDVIVNELNSPIPDCFGFFPNLTGLSLAGNNFTGPIPLSFGNLQSLVNISLEHNQFTGPVPDTLIHCPNLAFIIVNHNKLSSCGVVSCATSLKLNCMTFESIEQNIPFMWGGIYYPQDSVLLSIDTTVIVGTDLVLHSKVGGTVNQYLWKKNGSPLSGETDTSLILNNIALSDSGVYGCTINNSICISLTLHRRLINVHVQLPDALANNPENSLQPVITYQPTSQSLEAIFNFGRPEQTSVLLYDRTGRLLETLHNGSLFSERRNWPLSGLSPGLYLVQVRTAKRQWVTKIHVR
jgi:hypothetical protein